MTELKSSQIFPAMLFNTIILIALLVFLGVREYLNDRTVQRLTAAQQKLNEALILSMESQKATEIKCKQIIESKNQQIIELQRVSPGESNNLGSDLPDGLLDEFNINNVKDVMVDGVKRNIQIYG